MMIMIEATKENPAPLDGYESAKPDEPIFTLQGGDPLAAPLVRMWAYLARIRAGLSGDASMIDAPIFVAKTTSVSHDPQACNELLVRATAAEQISWHMDGYRRGEITHAAEIQRVSDLDKLDIYDVRRRCSSAISNFFSELNDFREELIRRGFFENGSEIDNSILGAILSLKTVHGLVEIRRGN
jgi:hypothetical protein